MPKIKVLKEIEIEEKMTDLKGWTIPKGTNLGIVKIGPPHPRTGEVVAVVRIDNGTGHWDLCPETVVRFPKGFSIR
jgi:CxxC motif-containing protein